MSLFTHWACFDCRKSFHRPSQSAVKVVCTECGAEMWDMGVYFEPPRRQAKRAWAALRVIAEGGYRFQTEGGKAYIDRYFLANSRPGVEEVRRRVEAHKGALKEYGDRLRLKAYKEEKKRRRS